MPALKQPKQKPIPALVKPLSVVCVPRAVVDWYWCRPWADVLAAGTRGDDGLTVVPYGSMDGRPDVAYLAEGQHNWTGRTVLHRQNW